MRRHTCNLIAIAATMLIMWACGGNDVTYCEFRQLSADGWAYGDTIGFSTTNMTDSIADGHLVVSLRHNNGYPYSNILARTDPHRQRRYYGTRHRKLRACRPIRPLERPGIRSIISVLRHSSQRCAPAAGRLYNHAAHNAHRHHYRHRTFRHNARSLNRITHLIPNFLWNYMHSRRLKKSAAEYRRYSR